MVFKLIPYVSVGPFFFGMTSSEAHSKIGNRTYKRFRKTPQSGGESEQFGADGFILHFSGMDALSAVEVTPPSNVQYEETNFFGIAPERFFDVLRGLDAESFMTESGYYAFELGVSFYASSLAKIPGQRIESIYAFEKGHYDSVMAILMRGKIG